MALWYVLLREDNNTLILKCFIDDDKELTFISNDNGLNWNLKNNN